MEIDSQKFLAESAGPKCSFWQKVLIGMVVFTIPSYSRWCTDNYY